MMKLAISPAATALTRALADRAGIERNRILLTEASSTDWQSLTFAGERHEIALRITGADSIAAARKISIGLEEFEFTLSRVIVADIAVTDGPRQAPDGSTELRIEALTVVSD